MKTQTKCWLVDGPGGRKWSVWDFGDEMTVHEGPALTDRVYGRVPERFAKWMDAGYKANHMKDAIGAVAVAKLLNSDSPNLHLLWQVV